MNRTFAIITALSLPVCGWAQDPTEGKKIDLTQINLEDLMKVEVTTVSKKSETLMDVAAAAYVITQDDIKHSGATNIPDLLRMVPGVQVSQTNASVWRITARGFNGQLANKLLVMIDGRSVYSPIFSGVYWDAQNVVLQDVERIEVIRGPGGSLWGANAVNGIINIITKNSKDTKGGLASVSYGSQERTNDTLRFGDKLGANGTYRVYTSYKGVEDYAGSIGRTNHDAYEARQGGFRTDWTAGNNTFSFSGDAYNIRESQRAVIPTLVTPFTQLVDSSFGVTGHNLHGKWSQTEKDGRNTSLQIYWDHVNRADPVAQGKVDTFDVDLQSQFQKGSHSFVYGLGFRRNREWIKSGPNVSFSQPDSTQDTLSAFFQDEIQSTKRLRFILGTKFERNAFTGWELQPSARVLYNKSDKETLWASVTRAVRTPTISEEFVKANFLNFQDPGTGMTIQTFARGNSNFKAEDELALEAGLRLKTSARTSTDMTVYFNSYKNLRSIEQGTPFFVATPFPHLEAPSTFGNAFHGNTAGFEISNKIRVNDQLALTANYTYFSTMLRQDKGSTDPNGAYGNDSRGLNPRHQFSFASFYNVSKKVDLDTVLTYMDRDIASPEGPLYRLDIRLAWHPSSAWELSLVGQDLLSRSAALDVPDLFQTSGNRHRSLYLSAQWKF